MSGSSSSLLPSLRAAWRWWTGELAQLVPKRWRRGLTANRGGIVLALTGDYRAELLQRGGGREETLAQLDLSPSRIEETREILASVRQRGGATAVRLPTDAGLSATMVLPVAAEGNLDQVVSFELDRRTPFKREEVYHSQRIVQRLDGGKRLLVQLTVVPRPAADGAIALAERLGLTLSRVELAGDDMSNFMPPRAQRLGARLPSLTLGALAAGAAVLAAIAVIIPLQRAHRTLETLQHDLAVVKQRADKSIAVQKEIDAEVQEGGFLAARKRQVPSASEVLYDLTHLLPEDTWLSELEITGGEVRLNGFADSASAILGLVDQSKHFINAAFRSPVVQDQRANREQFNIAARVSETAP
ncbi:MAG TPA: PilN domain-containing protein [Stellaceae bacterium]|nr:PilN domain-containing protein [Stellaceae bacterium]